MDCLFERPCCTILCGHQGYIMIERINGWLEPCLVPGFTSSGPWMCEIKTALLGILRNSYAHNFDFRYDVKHRKMTFLHYRFLQFIFIINIFFNLFLLLTFFAYIFLLNESSEWSISMHIHTEGPEPSMIGDTFFNTHCIC